MGKLPILALRVVIALALIGSLGVQILMMPLIWADLEETDDRLRILLIVILVLGILTMQVSALCVWRLLTMVRRGSVFTRGAFRYVDTIIGAIAAGSILTFLLAILLAPGDAAPGIVGLICGAALVIAGVALIVLVLRALLAQAVARELEAEQLRSELNEVI
ncbi:DUF2975 domain-containing protein [Mycetocola miduiensis]|uniref:DUF2975 domain-containing protein n=1 Tax=Mycetocola miduiensis TaxID=995034 RepID=A0A1I5AB61_9MICO|nr:DUF2975 domain-containing protein [Mycetocola miduiensis]SFN59821.1 Protein of unknown function [Mycetocola miduiensis]